MSMANEHQLLSVAYVPYSVTATYSQSMEVTVSSSSIGKEKRVDVLARQGEPHSTIPPETRTTAESRRII